MERSSDAAWARIMSAGTDVRRDRPAVARPRGTPAGAAAPARYPATPRPPGPTASGTLSGRQPAKHRAKAAPGAAVRRAEGTGIRPGRALGRAAKVGVSGAVTVGAALASGGTSAVVQTVAKQAAKPALKQLAKQAAKKTAKKAAQRATKRSGVRVGKRGRRWLVVVVVVVVALSPLTLLATFAAIAASVMGGMPEEMSFTGSGWSKEAERDIPAQYRALYEQAVATGCPGFPAPLLAAVGKVESDHGRGRASGIRSGTNDAGAAGPMQFLAGGPNGNTWGGAPVRAVPPDIPYGLDGNGDGTANVYDPADAIPAAARYLCAHWNHTTNGLSKAIFAYNHSDQYVDRVLQWYQTYRGPVLQPGDTQAPSLLAQKAIEIALAQVGKHYVFGTQGPNTFDCSGLTWYAYYHAGLRWTRGATTDQYRFGKLLPGSRSGGHPTDLGTLLASLQPGDLVYYDTTEPLGHMAMYLGRRNGTPMQVEAPNSRELVHVEPLGKFPVGATRPWATAAAQS